MEVIMVTQNMEEVVAVGVQVAMEAMEDMVVAMVVMEAIEDMAVAVAVAAMKDMAVVVAAMEDMAVVLAVALAMVLFR